MHPPTLIIVTIEVGVGSPTLIIIIGISVNLPVSCTVIVINSKHDSSYRVLIGREHNIGERINIHICIEKQSYRLLIPVNLSIIY